MLSACVVDDVVGGVPECTRCGEACAPFDVTRYIRVGERATFVDVATLPTGGTFVVGRPSIVEVSNDGTARGLIEGGTAVAYRTLGGAVPFVGYLQVTSCESTLCVSVRTEEVATGDRAPVDVWDLADLGYELDSDPATAVSSGIVEPLADGAHFLTAETAEATATADFRSSYWRRLENGPIDNSTHRLEATDEEVYLGTRDGIYVLDPDGRWRSLTNGSELGFQRSLEVSAADNRLYAMFRREGSDSVLYAYTPTSREWAPVEGLRSRDIRSSGSIFAAAGRLFATSPRYYRDDGATFEARALLELVGQRLEPIGFDTFERRPVAATIFGSTLLTVPGTGLAAFDLPTGQPVRVASPVDEPLGSGAIDRDGRLVVTGRHQVFRRDGESWTELDRTALPGDSSPARGRPDAVFRVGDDLFMRNFFWRTFRLEGDAFVEESLFPPLPSDRLPSDLHYDTDGRYVAVVRQQSDRPPEQWRSAAGQRGRIPRSPTALAWLEPPRSVWVGHPYQLEFEQQGTGELLFSVENRSIASVDGSGRLVGLRPGRTRVRMTAEHDPSVHQELAIDVVDLAQAAAGIVLSANRRLAMFVDEQMTIGTRIAFRECGFAVPEDLDGDPDGTSFAWVSADPSIATVDANGTVVAVSPGETVIRVALVEAPHVFSAIALRVQTVNLD